jgi:hypothetical protein
MVSAITKEILSRRILGFHEEDFVKIIGSILIGIAVYYFLKLFGVSGNTWFALVIILLIFIYMEMPKKGYKK